MENISKHLEIFFYIAAYFSGISCMTFVVFFSDREKKEVFSKAILFLAASFAYLSVNFLQFYKEYFFMSPKMNVLLMLLLDFSMAAFVCLWIRFSLEIVKPYNFFYKPGIIVSLSAVYVLGWLVIYMFFTDADYYITALFARRLAVLLDSLFYFGILIYISYGLIKQEKNTVSVSTKWYLMVMNVSILLYLGWFFMNDIILIYFKYGAELWDIYLYDPVILFYIFINIATMVCFFNRNGSFNQSEKLGDVTQKEIIDEYCYPVMINVIVEKYKLTKREEEIISLVYWGLSNPEISDRLYISTSTVKRHMQNIFKKMNIKHRSELIHLIKPQ